jgi:hypothetical protein
MEKKTTEQRYAEHRKHQAQFDNWKSQPRRGMQFP